MATGGGGGWRLGCKMISLRTEVGEGGWISTTLCEEKEEREGGGVKGIRKLIDEKEVMGKP